MNKLLIYAVCEEVPAGSAHSSITGTATATFIQLMPGDFIPKFLRQSV